jgi:hypothetical protein
MNCAEWGGQAPRVTRAASGLTGEREHGADVERRIVRRVPSVALVHSGGDERVVAPLDGEDRLCARVIRRALKP